MADQPLDDLVRQAKAIAKSVTVAELKNVLRQESLPVSGVKSELQIRLISRIERAHGDRDREALQRIRNRLTPGLHGAFANPYPSPYSKHTPTSSSLSPPYAPTPSRLPPSVNGYAASAQRNSASSSRASFQDSPFYTIKYPLSHVHECKVRETTRDTALINLSLTQNVIDEIERSNAGVMVFCAAEGKPTEIAFPHQVELKVNGNEVKTNLRGLKNKPGSTRPADITKYIRKKSPGLNNAVEMTYALTTKGKTRSQKFHLVVNLVQKKAVDNLVQDLLRRRAISKDQVVRELQRQAADPDIVATSSVMSLKCPLSYMRIKTPCRGVGCKHNQCFDALSYLQLQEQAPTWTCPICNKPALWEHLVQDQYLQDILQSTPTSTEEVTIEPDGSWHVGPAIDSAGANDSTNSKSNLTPTPSHDGDSDDAIEILDDLSVQAAFNQLPGLSMTPGSVGTPSINSRNHSQAPSATPASQSRSKKRPVSDVIDLTISDNDDDDDDGQPPVKRQRPSLPSASSSFHNRPSDYPLNGFSFTMPPPTSSSSIHQNNSPSSAFDLGNNIGGSY